MVSAVTAKPESAPPEVVTSPTTNPVGASEKVKVIVAVCPALNAALLLVMARVGARVS